MDNLKILFCDPDDKDGYSIREVLTDIKNTLQNQKTRDYFEGVPKNIKKLFCNSEVNDISDRDKLHNKIKEGTLDLGQYELIIIGFEYPPSSAGHDAIKLIEEIRENPRISKNVIIIFLGYLSQAVHTISNNARDRGALVIEKTGSPLDTLLEIMRRYKNKA